MRITTLVCCLCIFATATVHAQNVGIGTTTPHASAALQVSSTTRGFLPPRVTSTQRANIAGPLSGLMVYDTEAERMYIYQEGTWRYVLNNEVWATNGTSVYQGSMNVGIGNANPTEKLHVTGNIRLTGEVSTTGAGMTINNVGGTLTFQSAAVDKGFVQIAGDNLRIGTHSPNTAGKFIIRTGGGDQIFVNSDGFMGLNVPDPLARLDLGGNMRISGKLQHTTTGASHMLPVAYGLIRANAAVNAGSSGNFGAIKLGVGIYELTSDEFNSNTVIVATTTAVSLTIGAGSGSTSNSLQVYIRRVDDGELTDAWFNFVAFTR
jgi:hypothetical protein